MKENYTDITVVLDRSGSMGVIQNDTIGGFNAFLDDQQKAPGACTITLTQFDHEYGVIYEARNIQEAPALDRTTFFPRGRTALLDAIGRTIIDTGKRLEGMPEEARPRTVIFVILTDGEENDSKEFSRAQIQEMISHQRDAYGWSFVFLGANQDAISVAKGIGIQPQAAITYAADSLGTRDVFSSASKGVRSARGGQTFGFSQEDRDKQKRDKA